MRKCLICHERNMEDYGICEACKQMNQRFAAMHVNVEGYTAVVTSSSYEGCDIYVPHAEKASFWELVNICCFSNREFILSLEWSEYKKLFWQVDSLYDRIEMAICIIQNTASHKNPEEMHFIAEHINKAVKYALERNQKERLMFYRTKQLLSEERGFHAKKALSLAEAYANEASAYLKEILKG